MLYSYFLQIALPVSVKPDFFLPLWVKFVYDSHNWNVKSASKNLVNFIASLNDLLMVLCVFNLYFAVHFILYFFLLSSPTLWTSRLSVLLWIQFTKINFEIAWSQSREWSYVSSRKVFIALHGYQVLNVLVLLLNNLIAWKHNKVFFINHIVVQ